MAITNPAILQLLANMRNNRWINDITRLNEENMNVINDAFINIIENGLGTLSPQDITFTDDLVFTYDFGKYKIDSKLGRVTVPASGKTILELLEDAYSEEKLPTVTNPTVSFSLNVSTTVKGEVGTTFSAPEATLKVTSLGDYEYGPENTGVKFQSGNVEITTGSQIVTNSSDMLLSDTLSLTRDSGGTFTDNNQSVTFSYKAAYTDGVAPYTNLGKERLDLKIQSNDTDPLTGNKTTTYKGYRKIFGGGTSATSLTSAIIYALPAMSKNSLDTLADSESTAYEFTVASGSKTAVFAIPSDMIVDKNPVFQLFTMGWNYTETFPSQTIAVKAAGNSATKDYTVYTLSPPAGFIAETTNFRVYFN